MTQKRVAAVDDTPRTDDPSWLSRMGGPTFVVILLTIVVIALGGRGILPDLEVTQLVGVVSVFIGGEKAAKTVGRYVAKKRF